MEYKVLTPNNTIVRHTNSTIAQTELLQLFWMITINKSKNYRIKYNYNYSNLQTIEIIDKQNQYTHRFENVPVNMGIINSNELLKETREIYLGREV